jgi:hypothetical protein
MAHAIMRESWHGRRRRSVPRFEAAAPTTPSRHSRLEDAGGYLARNFYALDAS